MSDEPPAASADSRIGFASEIMPLFRESDRAAMRRAFDLWSYDDVLAHGPAIAGRLKDGSMPCDGAWPERAGCALRALARRGRRTVTSEPVLVFGATGARSGALARELLAR